MAKDETRATTRLYLITPPALDPERFAKELEEALAGGDVACLQLRLKEVDELLINLYVAFPMVLRGEAFLRLHAVVRHAVNHHQVIPLCEGNFLFTASGDQEEHESGILAVVFPGERRAIDRDAGRAADSPQRSPLLGIAWPILW